MKDIHSKETKTKKVVKAKENALDAEIQITSSENAQRHQETKIKGLSLEVLRAIARKMRKKEPKMKHWDQQVVSELVKKNPFLLKDIDQDSAHMMAASKVLMLKPGEYEIWRMRIEQYIQMIDYALLQKLVSQLELLDEKLSQEDVNQKLLRSLSPEWNTHAVVWRNKAELDTMSMDDLYKNLKVYEPEVKGMSSSSLCTQNMVFVSSSNNNTSNSSEAVNAAHGVTTTSTQVNTAYSTNIDNLSDAVICSFFASQPNSPRLT
ncbi:hypothetical protein Tco_0715344 [Tanacetum coccineum]